MKKLRKRTKLYVKALNEDKVFLSYLTTFREKWNISRITVIIGVFRGFFVRE